MKKYYRTVIVGAGASGTAAAIRLGQLGKECLLIERSDRIGRKVALSGNGRCNLTNKNITVERYNDASFMGENLPDYGVIADFFRGLGLLTTSVGDLVYPASMSSSAVLDVLRYALERENIPLELSVEVVKVERAKSGFSVYTSSGQVVGCRYLVLACGSSAGGGADSLSLASSLGLSTVDFSPALTSFLSSSPMLKGLNGVRVNAGARLLQNGEVIARSSGEILFKDNEISGIAAFDLSRFVRGSEKSVIGLDLFPDLTQAELAQMLTERIALGLCTRENAHVGMTHKEIFGNIFRKLGENHVTQGNAFSIASMLKNYELVTSGVNPAKAQIMRGGVRTECLQNGYETNVDGLFVTGEMLDIDGACGGYNLSHAWYSGIRVAESIGAKS